MKRRLHHSRRYAFFVTAILTIGASWSLPAAADQGVLSLPGAHPSYNFELEPHVIGAPIHDLNLGLGVRGTFVIVDNGFISSINNSVGIGVGVDYTKHFMIPVVMQWNFWLTRNWSVFGEPGVNLGDGGKGKLKPHPHIAAGGRFRLTEQIHLTGRIGFPATSVGVSFLL
ncbi:MAG: hypothetical protein HRU17_20665 [Polyangiaceae bacterium]|nr:hypothetical protein [Polyangiaceae bacterium]